VSSAKSAARLTPLISAPTCSLRGLICNFSSLCLLFLAFEFPPAVLEAPPALLLHLGGMAKERRQYHRNWPPAACG
jgi:hypothetical protein